MFVVPVPLPPGAPPAAGNVDESFALDHQASVVRFGRCELRLARRELIVDGECRELQPRPFDLLVYLIDNGDRVVTNEELLSKVWGNAAVRRWSLRTAVLRVRRALGRQHGDAIRTYQRVGYRFIIPSGPASM